MGALTAGRSVLAGGAILMTCACGAATASARLMGIPAGAGASGGGMATSILHPAMLAVGAGLMLFGLSQLSRRFVLLAMVAFALFGAGALITGPSVMTMREMPWNATHLFGAALYIVAAGILAFTLWRAFPTPKPSASGGAVAGGAVATGCGCCMVTGAVAGTAVTAGANLSFIAPSTAIHWTGLTMIAVGLFWLGGWRAAAWVPAGALVLEYGPKLLRLTGDWTVNGVALRFAPAYLLTLAGTGLIMYGFAVAYRRAWAGLPVTPEWADPLGVGLPQSAGQS